MRIAGLPAGAPVAEPVAAVGIGQPEDALLVAQQQLGSLDAERRIVQPAAVALLLQFAKAAFCLFKIH